MVEAVRFEEVCKRFILYHERPRSFLELVANAFRRGVKEEVWALKNISVAVPEGEAWGIVGPNGSGKSTLLKLIAGIIQPTSGKITVNGKVAALLELGAGFHPDLTGRENVYLSASILGLARREVDRRLDSIAQFAGVERFMDVPVKRYSSGMFLRLGFSVAIHMDPEILLIDEILAVGDAAFQRKCWEQLFRFRDEGTTIIVVSHDMGAIRRLCQRAILLDEGRVAYAGGTDETVRLYDSQPSSVVARQRGSGEVVVTGVRLLDNGERERRMFQSGEPMTVEVSYQASEPIEDPVFGVQIWRENDSYAPGGALCHGTNTARRGLRVGRIEGEETFRLDYDRLDLLQGRYYLKVAVLSDASGASPHAPYALVERVCPFGVSSDEGSGAGIAVMRERWLLKTPRTK
jgi:ABC-type polysaccharide/polyol phosphate transport system ATPase subunit